jgi:hypothetical protein
LARIVVGGGALLRAIVSGQALIALTRPEVVRAPYLEWLPDPTLPLAIVILTVWVVTGVLFVLGWRVPVTGSLLLISIVTTLALDQQTYSNHLYLLSWLLLLLTFADAGAGLNIRRIDRPVVLWPVLLIQSQLSIVYGFSALTKFNDSFLSGEVLAGALGRGLLPFPEALRTSRFLVPLSALAVFVELFVALFIWRRRFRPAAFVLGFGLHLAITLLMSGTIQLLVFSLEMLALYPLFLSRDRLRLWAGDQIFSRRLVRRLRKLDLLRTVDFDVKEPAADGGSPVFQLMHGNEITHGFRAITLTLEHLVPTLWVMPIMRLPGLRQLGELWLRRRTESEPVASAGDRL